MSSPPTAVTTASNGDTIAIAGGTDLPLNAEGARYTDQDLASLSGLFSNPGIERDPNNPRRFTFTGVVLQSCVSAAPQARISTYFAPHPEDKAGLIVSDPGNQLRDCVSRERAAGHDCNRGSACVPINEAFSRSPNRFSLQIPSDRDVQLGIIVRRNDQAHADGSPVIAFHPFEPAIQLESARTVRIHEVQAQTHARETRNQILLQQAATCSGPVALHAVQELAAQGLRTEADVRAVVARITHDLGIATRQAIDSWDGNPERLNAIVVQIRELAGSDPNGSALLFEMLAARISNDQAVQWNGLNAAANFLQEARSIRGIAPVVLARLVHAQMGLDVNRGMWMAAQPGAGQDDSLARYQMDLLRRIGDLDQPGSYVFEACQGRTASAEACAVARRFLDTTYSLQNRARDLQLRESDRWTRIHGGDRGPGPALRNGRDDYDYRPRAIYRPSRDVIYDDDYDSRGGRLYDGRSRRFFEEERYFDYLETRRGRLGGPFGPGYTEPFNGVVPRSAVPGRLPPGDLGPQRDVYWRGGSYRG